MESSDGRQPRRKVRRLQAAALATALVAFGFLVICAARAVYLFPSRQIHVEARTPIAPRSGFAERLGRAIRFRTYVTPPAEEGHDLAAEFKGLRAFLEREFSAVHATLEREVVSEGALLYRWRGDDPAVEPILLMSHLDVVPVESGSESRWTHPPFSGTIADGFIWGRGALDVKCGAIGLLEAVERLIEYGFRPRGDVYLALGYDEETGGGEGNRKVAARLRDRGVHFRFVLDEGGGLTEGIIEGIDQPAAFIGLAEKGYATVRLTAATQGGHSSMPPPHTAVGVMAAVVARLESDPFPERIDGATAAMLDFVGPETVWPLRAALANRWLTGRLIARRFAGKPSLNALIRTTTAATLARGGETANVLPTRAEAVVNVRILPGDTSAGVLDRIKAVARGLGFGEGTLDVALEGRVSEASRVSSVESEGFRALQRTIAEIYPGAVVAPGLTMAATDSRYYAPIASDVYRFLPLRIRSEDLARFHGVDERIGIDTYEKLIGFLARLIENFSGGRTGEPA